MSVILYICSILLANVITAAVPPIHLGLMIVPTGSFLIGLTFVFRDLVQMQYGRKTAYLVIFSALVLSTGFSFFVDEVLMIVIASACAFLLSETADTEIYTRLRLPVHLRVLWSGIFGGILDSSVFVILGLSPIGVGFLTWAMVPYAIAGQILVKTLMQFAGMAVLKRYIYNRPMS